MSTIIKWLSALTVIGFITLMFGVITVCWLVQRCIVNSSRWIALLLRTHPSIHANLVSDCYYTEIRKITLFLTVSHTFNLIQLVFM